MIVTLVHHADAVGPQVDPQRPLSSRGLTQAESIARQLQAAAVTPAAIWHSGKLRARQTAEPIWRLCNPFAEFKMVRGLGPDDPDEIMLNAILKETRDLALVGHQPSLPALLHRLCPASERLPLNGAVVLEGEGDGWRERARLIP